MTARIELVGDIADVSLAAVFGEPVPFYRLPLRIHLEGAGLGSDCALGSAESPIMIAPKMIAPPTDFLIEGDPNGYATEVLRLSGATLGDSEFSVPGATGCGPQVAGAGAYDPIVDELVGLPSPEGSNEALFEELDLALAAAGFDGVAPDGGAELEAAFEAAKH